MSGWEPLRPFAEPWNGGWLVGVWVCHGAPLRRASDDPSGASAVSPAPLTQTVSPHPPFPEATGGGGEGGYLASVESDRQNAGLGPKGRAALKKAERIRFDGRGHSLE